MSRKLFDTLPAALAVLLVILAYGSAGHATIITVSHLFDIEEGNGTVATGTAVTEPGWTHMDANITATGTTAGFVSHDFVLGAGHGTGSPVPTEVRNDYIVIYTQNLGSPQIDFRDIAPVDTLGYTVTVYRDSATDTYDASQTHINLVIDGGSPITIKPTYSSGTTGETGIHPNPVVYSGSVAQLGTTRMFDVKLYDDTFAGDTLIRLAGVRFDFQVFVPEPASAALVMLAGAVPVLRRKSRS